MRGKAALVVGLATGYVLGTRDGRARYQQIKTQANRIISDPRVQQKTAQATDLAKEKAPLVKDKIADATGKVSSKVTRSDTGSDLPEQTTSSAPDLTHASGDATTSGDSLDGADTSLDDKVDDKVDGDEIVLTPPSPSPLAPGPTQTSSSSGGSNG